MEVCPPCMVFPLSPVPSQASNHFRNSLYTILRYHHFNFITAYRESGVLLMGVKLLTEERIHHKKDVIMCASFFRLFICGIHGQN